VSDPGTARERTLATLRELVVEALELHVPEGELNGPDGLRAAVALDSVALLELIVAIERRFGVTLEEDWLDLERLGDLPALADYLVARSARGRATEATDGDDGTA
jgi:acyl carrier protein